jgi:hypothetical protein
MITFGKKSFSLPLLTLLVWAVSSAVAEEGVLKFGGGAIFEGNIVNGVAHGHGRYTFPNGDVYKGTFSSGALTGNGRITWYAGEIYEGGVVNGLPHGKGVWTDGRGNRYVGDFDEGNRSGSGTYVSAEGIRYVGGFVRDMFWGPGTLYGADGSIYRGRFLESERDGYGVWAASDGTSLVYQRWNSGKLEDVHTLEPDPDCRVTDVARWVFIGGHCLDGMAHGDGAAVSRDGRRHAPEAQFVLGRMVAGDIGTLGAAIEAEGGP